ncbi:MAG: hypothetical protein MUD08_16855, partial [Cytophagales bacterium]|nr:hypothetical protein [Cytophagales bacterium]
MTRITIFVICLLFAGATYAQQGRNTPRAVRQDQPQKPAPVQGKVGQKAVRDNSTLNTQGQGQNRNADRSIGDKNEDLIEMDTTANGRSEDPPHAKTPGAVKDKFTPNATTNRTNTPNSMAPPPDNAPVFDSYNRTSNGGVGRDINQMHDTFDYMTPNPNLPSAKMPSPSNPVRQTPTTAGPATNGAGGLSETVNTSGKTKMGTTGTGYSSGSGAGTNAGNANKNKP